VARSLRDLAGLAEQEERPGLALSAIAELRDRLDELEELQVENARGLGWSWSEIAQPLRISRQAVHHKHARRVFDARREERRGRMTVGDVRRCVARARREAAALGHDSVGTDHLLLGLLAGDPPSLLAEVGISCEQVREAVAERRGIPRRAPGSEMTTSSRARAALDRSLREADRPAGEAIRREHVLLALLRDEANAASQVLARLGVSAEGIERRLAQAR
jgi:hypothetical protein